MTITLYNNGSENNKITKVLSNSIQLTGTVKDVTNVENPEILFDMGTSASSYLNRNYAYISEFGRYYFIVDKNIEGNKLIRMKLKIDVLMSYADTILSTPALIERSEFYNSPHIADNSRPMYSYPMVLTKKFSGSFDAFSFFLTTAG